MKFWVFSSLHPYPDFFGTAPYRAQAQKFVTVPYRTVQIDTQMFSVRFRTVLCTVRNGTGTERMKTKKITQKFVPGKSTVSADEQTGV